MNRIEVVAAILVCGGEILCMQRGPSRYPYLAGRYEFPGGKTEPGESRPQALARELEEELGISVPVGEADFFMTVRHVYPDFDITLHSFLCDVSDRHFSRREHIGHRWIPADGLACLEWAAADLPIVERLISVGPVRLADLARNPASSG